MLFDCNYHLVFAIFQIFAMLIAYDTVATDILIFFLSLLLMLNAVLE